MRQGSFFSSVLYLLVIIFLAGLGILFIGLQWLDNLSEYLAKVMLYRPESFYPLGIFLVFLDFLLFLVFYRIYRHQYISVFTKSAACEVDGSILTAYAKKYFEELFNRDFIETEVLIFRNRLEIITYLPSSLKIDLNYYLDKAKKDFSKLLRDKFSYTNKFIIIIKTI